MRRRYAVLVLVLLLLAALAVVVQRVLFPPAPKVLEVVSVRGDVTVVDTAGATGTLVAGKTIAPGTRVKTGHEGEAILQGAGNSTITVGEHANVSLEGIASDGVSRVRVEEGRVRATVPDGGGGGVEITGGRENASVTTRGGDVAVGVDGRGDLSVATFRGKASLAANGSTRDVKPGELAVVSNGKVQVGAIPTEVLLKVAWPDVGKTRDAETKVAVDAPPGATVRINDAPVVLDSSGHGTIAVKLSEGENRLHLEAQDVVGNRKNEESGTIVLDTTPPEIHTGKARWK